MCRLFLFHWCLICNLIACHYERGSTDTCWSSPVCHHCYLDRFATGTEGPGLRDQSARQSYHIADWMDEICRFRMQWCHVMMWWCDDVDGVCDVTKIQNLLFLLSRAIGSRLFSFIKPKEAKKTPTDRICSRRNLQNQINMTLIQCFYQWRLMLHRSGLPGLC